MRPILRFKVASPTDNGPAIPSLSALVRVMHDSVVYWEVKGPVSTWEVIDISDWYNSWEAFLSERDHFKTMLDSCGLRNAKNYKNFLILSSKYPVQ